MWCILEMYTFSVLSPSNNNFCLELLGGGADHKAMTVALRTFDVANAECYDPADLANIRMLVHACGVRQFNEIRELATRFVDVGQSAA